MSIDEMLLKKCIGGAATTRSGFLTYAQSSIGIFDDNCPTVTHIYYICIQAQIIIYRTFFSTGSNPHKLDMQVRFPEPPQLQI